jgi:hypothetical protein
MSWCEIHLATCAAHCRAVARTFNMLGCCRWWAGTMCYRTTTPMQCLCTGRGCRQRNSWTVGADQAAQLLGAALPRLRVRKGSKWLIHCTWMQKRERYSRVSGALVKLGD